MKQCGTRAFIWSLHEKVSCDLRPIKTNHDDLKIIDVYLWREILDHVYPLGVFSIMGNMLGRMIEIKLERVL